VGSLGYSLLKNGIVNYQPEDGIKRRVIDILCGTAEAAALLGVYPATTSLMRPEKGSSQCSKKSLLSSSSRWHLLSCGGEVDSRFVGSVDHA